MTNKKTSVAWHSKDDFLSIVDLWHICLGHWNWILLSLIITMSIAVYYLNVTPNIYTRKASIMVKQKVQGKTVSNNKAQDDLNDLSLVQENVNVDNVLQHITSHDVILGVVSRLHLARGKNALEVASVMQKHLKAVRNDEKSTIVNLTYTDESPERAERVLTTLVQVYNEKSIREKNAIAINTAHFINNRLVVMEKDLGEVDDSISKYKSKHQITDLSQISDIYLKQQSESDAAIMKLNNQKAMAEYLRDILKKKQMANAKVSLNQKHELLPSNLGIDNSVTESLIDRYNTILLQLNQHLSYTSKKNSLIRNQEKELAELSKNILNSIDNEIKGINIQLQSLQGMSGEASEKISSNPAQAKHLISVERQQKVKESLYLYLLQKQEENDIAMTYASDDAKLINLPSGSNKPTTPVIPLVLGVAFVVGLMIPVLVLYIQTNLDNTVRVRGDLEHGTTIPVVGDIPLFPFPKKRMRRKFWKYGKSGNPVVVTAGAQDLVNEAFRVIRSNMEFMSGSMKNGGSVYIVTSNYSDSGKTFVSMNLAVTLALKSDKVLFVDGDLRHASATHYWKCDKEGLSFYLSGKIADVHEVICKSADYPGLHILPVGTIPPNPTELLSDKRFAEVLEQLRLEYEYILIDCPPVENLADTNIIEKYADRTLFVVRAGLFERSHLEDLEQDYQSNKYKHMGLVLNCSMGTDRFGYHYGYKYGYNYYHHHE